MKKDLVAKQNANTQNNGNNGGSTRMGITTTAAASSSGMRITIQNANGEETLTNANNNNNEECHSSRIHYNSNMRLNPFSTKTDFANVLSYSKLSEKEEESSIPSINTQETILEKPFNFNMSNSYSNEVNISNSNIMTTENGIINTSSSITANCTATGIHNISNNSNSDENNRNSFVYQPSNNYKHSLLDSSSSEVRKSMTNMNIITANKLSYNPIVVLKSHLDSVRGVHLTPDKKTLVSVGEDMLVNFWDFKKSLKLSKDNFEPYLTIRSHTTPIFSLTGPKKEMPNSQTSVYSSGIDGVIRCDRVPLLNFDKNQSVEDTNSSITMMPWRAHQDMIWQLEYHYNEALMASISSDGMVKIFKGYEENNIDKQCKFFYIYLIFI
jgi:hypothetical protein